MNEPYEIAYRKKFGVTGLSPGARYRSSNAEKVAEYLKEKGKQPLSAISGRFRAYPRHRLVRLRWKTGRAVT